MNIVYYMGAYYVKSDTHKAVFKVVQGTTIATTIEIVESMPEYGEYVDPQDVLWMGVIDNLNAFVKSIS